MSFSVILPNLSIVCFLVLLLVIQLTNVLNDAKIELKQMQINQISRFKNDLRIVILTNFKN